MLKGYQPTIPAPQRVSTPPNYPNPPLHTTQLEVGRVVIYKPYPNSVEEHTATIVAGPFDTPYGKSDPGWQIRPNHGGSPYTVPQSKLILTPTPYIQASTPRTPEQQDKITQIIQLMQNGLITKEKATELLKPLGYFFTLPPAIPAEPAPQATIQAPQKPPQATQAIHTSPLTARVKQRALRAFWGAAEVSRNKGIHTQAALKATSECPGLDHLKAAIQATKAPHTTNSQDIRNLIAQYHDHTLNTYPFPCGSIIQVALDALNPAQLNIEARVLFDYLQRISCQLGYYIHTSFEETSKIGAEELIRRIEDYLTPYIQNCLCGPLYGIPIEITIQWHLHVFDHASEVLQVKLSTNH
jgi:hypothetical protein